MHAPLERLQADFAAALTDAARVPAIVPQLVARDTRATERIALYRGNVRAAWEKALANAYPVVKALVGDEFFSGLARVYADAHPSMSGDLNRFGAHLAEFLADFKHVRELPYLADVADLEWSVHRAHYAGDAVALSRERVSDLPPEALLAARYDLHPACSACESHFPIASIWLAHQAQASVAMPDSLDGHEIALVVRPRWRVEVLVSNVGELAALATLRAGHDMEAAITSALQVDPDFAFPRALVRWIDNAVLVTRNG